MNIHRRWAAKWVWHKDLRQINSHVLFRRDFESPSSDATCQLFIAVETFAIVYFNGQEVLRTTSLSYPGQQNYEIVDLEVHLKAGENQLAILVWHIGVGSTATWLKDPGLLCEVEIKSKAQITRVGTDETWRCQKLDAWTGGARSRMFNLDLIEQLDYRLLPDGFPFPPDESQMTAPDVLPWPGVRMGVVELRDFPTPIPTGDDSVRLIGAYRVRDHSTEHTIPAMAVSHESLHSAVHITDQLPAPATGEALTLVYDLNGYHIGTPQIMLDAPSGTIVDLSWCETLSDGHFDARPNQPWTTDRYTLREGLATIKPQEWKAGRFMQLTFRRFDRSIQLRSVRFIREHYPLTQRMTLTSSDERLNQIFKISRRAAALCMHDRIMDCPWRERRQWIGDVQRIALVNYYSFDDRLLIRNALKQQARLQDPTGRMWVCMPLMEEYPTQSMEWVRAIVEYDHYTGDTTLADDLADNVEWLHRWFLKCRDAQGLFFNSHPPVQNWMDNPLQPMVRDYQHQTAFLSSNLRYLQFLDDIAMLLQRAGQSESAERAKAARIDLAGRIIVAFLDSESGLLRECADPKLPIVFSEYAAALAVNAGLPDFDAAAHWDRYNALAKRSDPRTVASSPFGKYQTFEALGKMGRESDIIEHIVNGWGPMVDAGSDTAWEWFNEVKRGSQCHGWSGVPVVAVLRHILKVDPRRPHQARCENIGPIAWIKCEKA